MTRNQLELIMLWSFLQNRILKKVFVLTADTPAIVDVECDGLEQSQRFVGDDRFGHWECGHLLELLNQEVQLHFLLDIEC